MFDSAGHRARGHPDGAAALFSSHSHVLLGGWCGEHTVFWPCAADGERWDAALQPWGLNMGRQILLANNWFLSNI